MIAAVVLTLIALVPMVMADESEKEKSLYDFTMKDIDGKEVKMKDFKGNVLLIVNTASKCGYTPQYKDMVDVYKQYKKEGLVVLGFPANEFGRQEPGADKEIKEFCTLNYKVNFPMFSKVVVKGEKQNPLFRYLTTQKNPDFTGDIKWNFEKFLIARDGRLLHRFRSKVKPTDKILKEAIEEALKEEIPKKDD
ncbi:MAG: glutathione peroxidase [Candidatus Omnitrophica bacterium]|nr:glutathione peroxidase [Candidatus Omnitrophota bacterium]